MRLAGDLVRIEQDGFFVLMNSRFARPLVFSRGKDVIQKALADPNGIEDPELHDLLVRFRILVSDGPEPPPNTHQLFRDDGKTDLGLYLLTTQACNLACKYCLGDNKSYLNSHRMEFETAQAAIIQAAEAMLPKGSIQLIYFGGEPLLNWPLVRDCIQWVDEQLRPHYDVRFKHHVTSNLTTLPADFIEIANKHDVSVLVDVGGPKEIHDRLRPFKSGRSSYDQIIDNLRRLSEAGVYFELRATITSDNVSNILEIQKHHSGLKPVACAFPTLIPVDSEGRPLDASLFPDPGVFGEQLKAAISERLFDLSNICPSNVIATRILRREFVVYGCGMILGNTAVVDHRGDIYPCIYFVGQPQFRLANVHSKENCLSQTSYRNFYEKFSKALHVDNLEGCAQCAIRYFCGGGCSVRMLSLQRDDEETRAAREYFRRINCAASWASVNSAVVYFLEKAKDGGLVLTPQSRL